MTQHVLHHPQVHPGGQGQRGRAMAQVMRRTGGSPAWAASFLNIRVSRSGAIGSPLRLVNTYPLG